MAAARAAAAKSAAAKGAPAKTGDAQVTASGDGDSRGWEQQKKWRLLHRSNVGMAAAEAGASVSQPVLHNQGSVLRCSSCSSSRSWRVWQCSSTLAAAAAAYGEADQQTIWRL